MVLLNRDPSSKRKLSKDTPVSMAKVVTMVQDHTVEINIIPDLVPLFLLHLMQLIFTRPISKNNKSKKRLDTMMECLNRDNWPCKVISYSTATENKELQPILSMEFITATFTRSNIRLKGIDLETTSSRIRKPSSGEKNQELSISPKTGNIAN